MTTVFILGYNNLGTEFWNNHIRSTKETRFIFFREGKALLNKLGTNPDLIVVDNYFSEDNSAEEFGFKDIIVALELTKSHTPCFYFSPAFTGKTRKNVNKPHYYSNFNNQTIDIINSTIDKKESQKIKAA